MAINTSSFRKELESMSDDDLRHIYWENMLTYLNMVQDDNTVLGYGELIQQTARTVQVIQEEISKRKMKVV